MLISLFFPSFLLLNYIGHGLALIDLKIDEDKVERWKKSPLCFSGFRGCGGAKLRLTMSSLIMEIKKCGNVASSKLDRTYVASHIKFLWGQDNPLSSDEPGKIEGAEHKLDGKTNTMEVQFFFYDNKQFEGIEHASWSNGVKVVSVFLQTDTRLIDNPRFSSIVKYVQKVSRFNAQTTVRSWKWIPKLLRRKTDKTDSGPPRKMPGIFDAFYGAFNTANKRVLHYQRQKLKMGDREIKTQTFVVEEAIPVSPEQVYAFWKLIPDFNAPHVTESIGEEVEEEVFAGPKY